ncbi:MAG: hypothetical protein ACP6IY_11985, partial [Promethearchaeia archaeon]
MDLYIVDAVAFLAYLIDKLPKNADEIFNRAENNEVKLLLPSIVLGEVLYTIYKGRKIFGKPTPSDKIELIFQIIQFKDLLKLVDLNIDAWRIFHNL